MNWRKVRAWKMFVESSNSRIIFILVIGLLTGVSVYLGSHIFLAPQWEVAATIKVGQTPSQARGEPKLLTTLDEVEQFMRVEKATLSTASALRIRRVSTSMVEVRVSASTQEAAQRVHSELVSGLIKDHDKIYVERVGFWKSEAEQLKINLKYKYMLYSRIENECSSPMVDSYKTILMCAVLNGEKRNLSRDISNINRGINMLNYDMQNSFTYRTSIYGADVIKLNHVSSVFRFLLSVLSAFSACAVLVVYFKIWTGAGSRGV